MKGLTTYNLDLSDLISKCKQKDSKAQKLLYQRISPLVLGVCRRYIKDQDDAEDMMIETMFKILSKIDQYAHNGNFEGWCRRIAVNECLMFLRKKQNFHLSLESNHVPEDMNVHSRVNLEEQDILRLIDKLPTGYRTVFNLYVIEGYKHREIAEKLGISINTSKSQLILAKKKLQQFLINVKYPGIGL